MAPASRAPAGPPAWPLLPLLLLRLCWAPPGAGTPVLHVEAPAREEAFLGGPATLRCHLSQLAPGVHVTQVTWLRREPAGQARSVAVFHPTRGVSFLDPERMEFVAARPGAELRDATLAVRAVVAEDEANYTCVFSTFPQGSGRASTRLRVLAEPQNQVEALAIMLGPEPVPVARCVSSGGRPPARISWSTHPGGKATNSQVPGPRPGTVTVTSLLTLVPSSQVDGETVTCIVEHESLEEPALLPLTLAVRYAPTVSISGYSDDWYLGLSEATLSCDVHSNPEPTVYNWRTAAGPLPPSAVARGHQLLIQPVDLSANTTFICSVNNTVGTGQAEQTVLVRARGQSRSALSLGIIAAIVVGALLLLLLLGALLYFKIFRNSRESPPPTARQGRHTVGAQFCATPSSHHLRTVRTPHVTDEDAQAGEPLCSVHPSNGQIPRH
ncbi:poliovirus receptor isoform X1 [Dasypus novemcinctus]|uniref:poliovirus receptor isoform X1 n=1 Tax=Dasypus novemcinctus TaxID=9361 RepID=UPI00265DC814|nr:poliovirus receptor isoform X1 [Dasypus novemcinctus]